MGGNAPAIESGHIAREKLAGRCVGGISILIAVIGASTFAVLVRFNYLPVSLLKYLREFRVRRSGRKLVQNNLEDSSIPFP